MLAEGQKFLVRVLKDREKEDKTELRIILSGEKKIKSDQRKRVSCVVHWAGGLVTLVELFLGFCHCDMRYTSTL